MSLYGGPFLLLLRRKHSLSHNNKQVTLTLRFEELKKEEGWDTEEKVYENMWCKLKLGVHHDVEVTSKDWGTVLSDTPHLRQTQV